MKGWKNIFQSIGNQSIVRTVTADKIDFNQEMVKRAKDGYLMINGSTHQEDIAVVNIYAPNIIAPKYIKQMLEELKGEIKSNTIILRDINTPL